MARKTKYCKIWEEHFTWLRKHDDFNGKCDICNTIFRIDGSGKAQVAIHGAGKKHIASQKLKDGLTSQSLLRNANNSLQITKGTVTSRFCLSAEDKMARAETIWSLKCVESNFSFASNDDMSEIFMQMFPDSEIAKNYKMSETKLKYVIQFGVAPYIKDLLMKDVKDVPFTFHFDETTTCQVKKQFDGYLHYWSPTKNKIVPGAYCGSLFVGHCTSEDLMNHFYQFCHSLEISPQFLLQLGMDGPNVNLKFQRLLKEDLECKMQTSFLDIGTCNLHPIHNAFRKGLSGLKFDVDQFSNDTHFFFKYSSARREDFQLVKSITDVTVEYLLRHVSSRWLSLIKVMTRQLSQWSNLKVFFLEVLPKQKNFVREIASSSRYQRIVEQLKNPETTIYLSFLIYVAEEFQRFLVKFQSDKPLIHLVYPSISSLLLDIMNKFLKKSVTYKDVDLSIPKEGRDLAIVDCSLSINQKSISKLEIGTKTKYLISSLKPEKQKLLNFEFLEFFKVVTTSLQTKLPFHSIVLRDIQYIHPSRSLHTQSTNAISRLAITIGRLLKNNLFSVFNIDGSKTENDVCDLIRNQWMIYQTDLSSTHCVAPEKQSEMVIDEYWASVGERKDLHGIHKYPQLFALVKCCLSLSHGNATPERGFSINKAMLNDNRSSLQEDTIVALRIVKDAIQQANGVKNFPISRQLLQSVQQSHKKYSMYQEEMKKIKEKEKQETDAKKSRDLQKADAMKRKHDSVQKLDKLSKEREELQTMLKVANEIVFEANQKLKLIMCKNKLVKEDVQSAHAKISIGLERQKEITIKLEQLEKEINSNQKVQKL